MSVSLLAPVGGQPQVVTFALDWLLRQGETIDEVYVVHLSPANPRVAHTLACLHREFAGDRYAGSACRLRRVPLVAGDRLLVDICNGSDAEIAWRTARDLIAGLKQQGQRLHLCVAGGRRIMGLMVAAAAALLCDHQDRLWHLYTPDALRVQAAGGAVLHVEPTGGVQLIQVPLAPWGAYFPALRAMAQAPQEAVAAQMGWLRSGDEARCQAVAARLTARQVEVLQAFAAGLAPQEVAEHLVISLKTVDAHKVKILGECRNGWEMAETERLTYHFLREKFGRYFENAGTA